jgi:hypothetical protein
VIPIAIWIIRPAKLKTMELKAMRLSLDCYYKLVTVKLLVHDIANSDETSKWPILVVRYLLLA